MVYGVVAYGYLTASVAASMVNADAGRAQYQAKLKAIKSYLQVRCGIDKLCSDACRFAIFLPKT